MIPQNLYEIRFKVRDGKSQLAHPQYNSDLIDYDYMVMTVARIVSKKEHSVRSHFYISDLIYFVLKQNSPWEFNAYAAPIKIVNPSDVELPNFTACQTSGYGYTEE